MAEEKVPTWLYHKQKGGKIHSLAPSAPRPKGWRDTPWPEEKAAGQEEAKDESARD